MNAIDPKGSPIAPAPHAPSRAPGARRGRRLRWIGLAALLLAALGVGGWLTRDRWYPRRTPWAYMPEHLDTIVSFHVESARRDPLVRSEYDTLASGPIGRRFDALGIDPAHIRWVHLGMALKQHEAPLLDGAAYPWRTHPAMVAVVDHGRPIDPARLVRALPNATVTSTGAIQYGENGLAFLPWPDRLVFGNRAWIEAVGATRRSLQDKPALHDELPPPRANVAVRVATTQPGRVSLRLSAGPARAPLFAKKLKRMVLLGRFEDSFHIETHIDYGDEAAAVAVLDALDALERAAGGPGGLADPFPVDLTRKGGVLRLKRDLPKTVESYYFQYATDYAGAKAYLERFPSGHRRDDVASNLAAFKDRHDYEAATTLATWRRYLLDHPDGEYVHKVEGKIDAYFFARATDPAGARTYLREMPDGDHRVEVEERLRGFADDAAFAAATDLEGWRRYLKDYPAGRHVKAAKRRVEEHYLERATDVAGMAAYLRTAPDGAHAPEIRARLEKKLAPGIATRAGAIRYLRALPKGVHAAEVRTRLADQLFPEVDSVESAEQFLALLPEVPRAEKVRERLEQYLFEACDTAAGCRAYLQRLPQGPRRQAVLLQLKARHHASYVATRLAHAEGARVHCVAFAPGGSGLVTATAAGQVQFWSTRDWSSIPDATASLSGRIDELRYSPDGLWLLAHGEARILWILPAPSGNGDGDGNGNGGGSADGASAASGPVARVAHASPIQAVAMAGDGARCATLTADGAIRLIALPDAAPASTPTPATVLWSGRRKGASHLLLPAAADRLVVGDASGRLRIIDWKQDKDLAVLGGDADKDGPGDATDPNGAPDASGAGGAVTAVALHPEGRQAAFAAKGRRLYLVDLEAGTIRHRITYKGDDVAALAFGHDGRWLAALTGARPKLLTFAVDSGKSLSFNHAGPVPAPVALAATTDARRVVYGDLHRAYVVEPGSDLWLEVGDPRQPPLGRGVAFSPRAAAAVAIVRGSVVEIWSGSLPVRRKREP